MAVDFVTELTGGSASGDKKGNISIPRRWLVICDDFQDDQTVAILALPVSQWDAHPTSPAARYSDVSAEPGELPGHWIVTTTYTTAELENGSGGSDSDQPGEQGNDKPPPSRPWTIKRSASKGTRILGPDDLDGEPVWASNKEKFADPPEIPNSNTLISISGYFPVGQQAPVKEDYIDTINDAPFMGYAAKVLRCNEFNLERTFTYDDWFVKFDCVLELNNIRDDLGVRRGWNPVRVLDAGTYTSEPGLSGSDPPTIKKITDADGAEISSPVPLDGNGQRLGEDADPVFREFKGYYERDWTNLLETVP